MVGDGINDAPALVSAWPIRTDVARESADIILIGSDLPKFVETLRVARRCHGIIMQNFLGTLLTDSIGVALAAFGFLIQWWSPSFASPLNWVSSSTPQDYCRHWLKRGSGE
jgi:P-type E1-E2 ATPase